MAPVTTINRTLHIDKLVEMVQKDHLEGCSKNEEYPTYSRIVHYLFIVIYILYIPVIIFSSTMIISAVNYLKVLHNPHNYIIRAIAVMDIMMGVIRIPIIISIELPSSRCAVSGNMASCYIMWFLNIVLDNSYISFLTFLCIDRFLMIRLPTVYRNNLAHSYFKYVVVPIIMIVLMHMVEAGVFLAVQYYNKEVCMKEDGGEIHYRLATLGVKLLVCLCSCLYVFLVSWKRRRSFCEKDRRNDKVTMALIMLFIVLYTPTVCEIVTTMVHKHPMDPMIHNITRLIKLWIPITNIFVVNYTRPMYKKAFVFFLHNKPTRWYDVQRCTALNHQMMNKSIVSAFASKRLTNVKVTPIRLKSEEKIIKREPLRSINRDNSENHSQNLFITQESNSQILTQTQSDIS